MSSKAIPSGTLELRNSTRTQSTLKEQIIQIVREAFPKRPTVAGTATSLGISSSTLSEKLVQDNMDSASCIINREWAIRAEKAAIKGTPLLTLGEHGRLKGTRGVQRFFHRWLSR